MKVEKLVEEINENFGTPFLPDGFVEARINHQGDFVLRIGTRDVQLESDGKWVGSGTDLTRYFDITEHEAEPIIVEEN